MKKLTTLVVAVAVIAGLARLCLYTVGEREYALVFGLGELKHIQAEPGLYVKLPAPLQTWFTLISAFCRLTRRRPTSCRQAKKRTFSSTAS